MLANAAEANKYLDETKLKFQNDDDASDEIEAADTHLKAALFDVYGDVVGTWALATVPPTPGEVVPPDIVTEYAAMWMAAMRYAKVYSGETNQENAYAARLYKQVDEWLDALRAGSLTIEGIESGLAFDEDDFWPNSTDVVEGTTISARKFAMDQRL